jgi:hypothetical protein
MVLFFAEVEKLEVEGGDGREDAIAAAAAVVVLPVVMPVVVENGRVTPLVRRKEAKVDEARVQVEVEVEVGAAARARATGGAELSKTRSRDGE